VTVDAPAVPTAAQPAPVTGPDVAAEPPAWLRVVALASAGGVLTFGWVGLLLAVNGWYRPAVALPLGALAWAGVLALARPMLRSSAGEGDVESGAAPGVARRAPHAWAAAGVVLILGITAWHAMHVSQHVLINRDGGSYANTGRWIARDGSLEVEPRVGPFATEPGLRFESFAVYEMEDHSLQFQFSHLLPVVLAEAHALAGDRGLFRVPAVLGGIALLAFFVLAWRVTRRPAFALVGMLALAFLVPQVSYSRDAYSEIPSQILVFTAVGLLVSARGLPHWRLALVAGLFLGSVEATRVDGVAYLVGVPALLAFAWLRAPRSERGATARSVGAFAAGVVPGLALGLVDLSRHSGRYFDDLSKSVRQLTRGAVGVTITSLVVVLLWPLVWPLVRRLPWRLLAMGGAVAVALAGFAAWAYRPEVQTFHGRNAIGTIASLQHTEGKAVDPTRTYAEFSMQWMWWYLGKVTLAAAIVGAALVVYLLLRGRSLRLVALLAVFVPGSLLYLWRPRAVADHVWVDRRFLVGALPLLILLAMVLAATLWSVRGRWTTLARALAVVIAFFAVTHPLYTVRPVRAMAEQRTFLGVIDDVCDTVGKNAAVIVVENEEDPAAPLLDDWAPQAFRGWCGADVAISRGTLPPNALQRLAAGWRERGRALFLVAGSAPTIEALLPGAAVTPTRAVRNTRLLAATLTHRPDDYRAQSFALVVAPVVAP
jgi:hypothetical protein